VTSHHVAECRIGCRQHALVDVVNLYAYRLDLVAGRLQSRELPFMRSLQGPVIGNLAVDGEHLAGLEAQVWRAGAVSAD
jgi:hypothetical protein